MKKILPLIAATIFCWSISGCHKDNSVDSMAFDKVIHVTEFPESEILEDGEKLELGLIGIRSLSVKDSLLIVSTIDENGCWSFFNIPEYSNLGKYLKKGRAETETLDSPRVAKQHFFNKNGKLYSIVYDFYTGDIVEMDISGTLHEKHILAKKGKAIDKNLFNVIYKDSSSFICRKVNDTHTMQSRFILKNGEEIIPENMKILNEAQIAAGNDINLLGTYCCYNPTRKLIVEAGMGLSVINLYSVDNNSERKTICPEKQLLKISDLQKRDRRQQWSAYCHLAAYNDFFAVLYQGDTAENIHMGNARKQAIQFFDWNGKPLAELILEKSINSFDIDFSGKVIYTLNYNTDEIYKYSFPEILF